MDFHKLCVHEQHALNQCRRLARQIVHMDLKSPNVLLQDKNYLVAKIADLGLSRQIAEGSMLTNTFLGMHLLIWELRSLTTCQQLTAWCLQSNASAC